MSHPDLYANHIGTVLCVAPTTVGRFAKLAQAKRLSLYRDSDIVGEALSRWIFADVPTESLLDQWGNKYNHQVHTLLAGSLKQGEELLSTLEEHGCCIQEDSHFFVPLQNLNVNDQSSSDALRAKHPRAFALARREPPDLNLLLTLLRDAQMLG